MPQSLRELTRLPTYPAGSQAVDVTESQEAEELTVEQLSNSALLAAAVLATHEVSNAATWALSYMLYGICRTGL